MRLLTVLGLFLFAITTSAGEKKLMHCFAFTIIDSATDAEWAAFAKATDELPGKIPGLTKVWHGKLRQTLSIFNPDPASRKKLMAGEEKSAGEITYRPRKHGVCMEMDDEAALKTYTDHPAHKEWSAAYEKVRVAGTTTFDIIGQ